MSSNIWLQFQHCVLSKALWQVMALLDHSTWTGPPPSGPWDGGRISDNTLITLLVVAHWPTPTLAPPTCSLLPQHPKNTLQLVTQHSAHNPPFHWPLGGAAVCSCLYRPCLPSCGLALIWLKHVMNWPHQTSWGVGSGGPSTAHWTCQLGWEDTPNTFHTNSYRWVQRVILCGESELSRGGHWRCWCW